MTGIDAPGGESRREELIAAALAGDLSPDEARELDRLREADPSIDRELASFGVLLDGVRGVEPWQEAEPSPQLRARVLGVPAAGRATGARRVRTPVAIGAAAACLALGAVGGLAVGSFGDRPVEGAPGTLGAVETIAFEGPALGGADRIDVDGSVVAHTWGTETVLRGNGFTVGESYDLVVVTDTGERLASGSFLGSAAELDCEMNAAVLRESVASIEITDSSGAPVAVATLPEV